MGTKRIAALAVSLLALPAAVAAISEPTGLASRLRAPANEEPAFMLSGTGDHIFECRPNLAEANSYQWVFVAPDATLYEGPRSVGRMATANMWEHSSDRTSVSGVVRAIQPGGADNLPWALLRAYPAGETGLFAGVTSIQRVNTTGGIAPATGCDASHSGSEARVAFSADYYFYKRRG